MKGNAEVVNVLNQLLAGELMATDQYLLHGEMYADMGLQNLRSTRYTNRNINVSTREILSNESFFLRVALTWPLATS